MNVLFYWRSWPKDPNNSVIKDPIVRELRIPSGHSFKLVGKRIQSSALLQVVWLSFWIWFMGVLPKINLVPSPYWRWSIGCREEHPLKDRAMCRIFVRIHVNGQIARNPSKPSATALSMNAVNSLTGAYPAVITQPYSEVRCQSPLNYSVLTCDLIAQLDYVLLATLLSKPYLLA